MASRAEHRRTTLLRLSAATTEAFEALGPATTIDDIAERAGVSRRTIFRYVDNKEGLIFIHPLMWLDVFDEAIAEVADAEMRTRLLHATSVVCARIDNDPEPVWRAMRIAAGDPTLMRGYAGVSQQWVNRITSEVLGSDTEPEAAFRARILGAAVMGVIDAALADWFATTPRPSLATSVARGLDYLAPIFAADS